MNKLTSRILICALLMAFISAARANSSVESTQASNNIRSLLNQIEVNSGSTLKFTPQITNLGWLLVWLGENESHPTKELDILFAEVETKCQFISVPYYICFEDDRRKFLHSFIMENLSEKASSGVLLTALATSENSIGHLLINARNRISDRTGYRFKFFSANYPK